MKPHPLPKSFGVLIITFVFAIAGPNAFAHCDGLDGPVVQAAEKALAAGDVNQVLIWVQPNDEKEIRHAFAQALAVRKLGSEARELADRSFFETLVRVHRAGEGAPYTGLKPAGRDLGPAIPAADKALETGSSDALLKLLLSTIEHRVREHFEAAVAKKKFAAGDLAAGRAFVKAYVEFIHCAEALYQQATKEAHGHFDEAPAEPAQHKH